MPAQTFRPCRHPGSAIVTRITSACSMRPSRRAASGATVASSGAVARAGDVSAIASNRSSSTTHVAPSRSMLATGSTCGSSPPAACTVAAVASTSAPTPPRGAAKIGPVAGFAARPGPRRPGREQQAPATGGQLGELRDGVEAGVVGVGCVDAADEGVDEAFVDLVAEASPDVGAEHVVGRRGARQERLARGPQLAAPRQQPGGDERPETRPARRARSRRGSRAARRTTPRPSRRSAT